MYPEVFVLYLAGISFVYVVHFSIREVVSEYLAALHRDTLIQSKIYCPAEVCHDESLIVLRDPCIVFIQIFDERSTTIVKCLILMIQDL